MRLEEYFHNQQQITLSESQKLAIYEKVMRKRLHGSFQKKRSFLHVKSFVYSSFMLIAIFGLYGTYFFTQQSNNQGDLLVLDGQSSHLAQADYLAKVVEFQGSFFVEKDGKMIQTSMIANGDIVSLKEGAQLTFTIDNDTKAKLIGPAKFTLEKKKGNSTYQFNLFYGNYVEVKSLTTKNSQDIKFSANKLTISKTDNKPLDFTLVTEGERNIIKNNGAKLLVKNDGKSTSISSKQVLAIKGNDISLFDSFEKFAKAMQKGNLSQTFSLNDTVNTDTFSGNASIKTLEEPEILAVNENETDISASSLSTLVPDSKIVATEIQIKVITNQLSSSLIQTISDLKSALTTGDIATAAKLDAKLSTKLDTIAKAFSFSEFKTSDSLGQQATTLKAYIANHFLIPPKYLSLFDPLIALK